MKTSVLLKQAKPVIRIFALIGAVAFLVQACASGAPAAVGTAWSKPASDLFDRGMLFAERMDFDSAIECFNEAINIDPDFAEAFMQRGKAYITKQPMQTRSLKKNRFLLLALDGYVKNEEVDLAIADLTQAIKLEPDNSDAYAFRSVIYSSIWEPDNALADSNKAITLDPNNAVGYLARGIASLRDKGRKDDFSQAIKLDPNFAEAYIWRSFFFLGEDMGKAIEDCSKAIMLDPNDVNFYCIRGSEYLEKGDCDSAIADFSQAIMLDPDWAMGYNGRGGAYFKKGDYDSAIANYSRAIMLDPGWGAGGYYVRGGVHFEKGDYDSAIADFSQAIMLDPGLVDVYNLRGDAYFEKGDYDSAIADYNQAIRLWPDNSTYRDNLEKAIQAKGN